MNDSLRHPWRALGAAFLAAGSLAIVAGVSETWLAPGPSRPSWRDLLYGVDVHLLLAVLLTFALRLALWRAEDRTFPRWAAGGLLIVELGVVIPFWLNARSLLPPFATTAGKLATAALGLLGVLLALALVLLMQRRAGRLRDRRPASRGSSGKFETAPAAAAITLAACLVLVNGVLLLRAAPRSGSVTLAPDAAAKPRPNVFVILIDTLRRDHVSFFGYDRPTTPNLDRLLGESYAFANAYTPSTWTIPSVASLFTGLYPSSHGIYDETSVLPPGTETLARYFRNHGYRTAAFVANRAVSRLTGYDQGFERFADNSFWWGWSDRTFVEGIARWLASPPSHGEQGLGPVINRGFLQWADAHAREPLFAYLHYMDPHHPYDPPPSARRAVAPDAPPGPRQTPSYTAYARGDDCGDWECVADPPRLDPDALTGMIANYDGDIRYLDSLIGELLAELRARGHLDQAHLFVFSDHGEEFFEHRGWRHGRSIYEEISGCVMAYRPPGGLVPGRIVTRPVAMLDLARTMAEILGREPPELHQGRSIPEIVGGDAGAPVPVLCERPPHLYSLRLRDWKLIRRGPLSEPDWRLFDLRDDPRELRDRAPDEPDTLWLLRSHLDATVAALEQVSLGERRVAVDPRALERLRALGYIR